jgi:hypothetical protein
MRYAWLPVNTAREIRRMGKKEIGKAISWIYKGKRNYLNNMILKCHTLFNVHIIKNAIT